MSYFTVISVVDNYLSLAAAFGCECENKAAVFSGSSADFDIILTAECDRGRINVLDFDRVVFTFLVGVTFN